MTECGTSLLNGMSDRTLINFKITDNMVLGYNIAFKANGKTFCGRTQDDLTIAANVKESLTKDDQGETQVVVSGHDITFSCSGIIVVGDSTATKLDRDAIIALALLKDAAAVVPIVYSVAGGATYGGNAIITNYTESSNSEDNATYTIDFRVTGGLTLQS